MTDEEVQEILANYAGYQKEEQIINNKSNDRLFRAVRSVAGEVFLRDLVECMEENGCSGRLDITQSPSGHFQEEKWESFDGMWVDQYVDGGQIGDTFEGCIYVKVREGKYIRGHYNE